jgi:hypothetical protein
MRKPNRLAIIISACALTGLATVATAQDRPNLLDVPFTSVLGAPPPGYTYNTLQMMLDETTPPSASQQSRIESANAAVEKPGADRVALRLYEPDSVKRKSDQAQLKQSDNLFLFVRLVVPTFTASGVVTGCKGQASVKKNPNATQTFSWNYSCKSLDAAMQELGVPAPIRSALTGEFADKNFKMVGKQTQ